VAYAEAAEEDVSAFATVNGARPKAADVEGLLVIMQARTNIDLRGDTRDADAVASRRGVKGSESSDGRFGVRPARTAPQRDHVVPR
jgi:hypothetical protein